MAHFYCPKCKKFVEDDEICWDDDFVAEAWGHPVYVLTPFCGCGAYLDPAVEQEDEEEDEEEEEDEDQDS